MNFSDKSQFLKPSPTLALAQRAKELQAGGADVISLAVGEPDWPSFPEVIAAAKSALESDYTKYTAAAGIPELKTAIAEQTFKETGIKYAANQIAVGAGAKYAIFAVLQVILNKGDEVLIPTPSWVSYPTMVELAGGVPKFVRCSREQRFNITADLLAKNISSKTKAVMICSPNNPTGISYSTNELKQIIEVFRANPNLWIISDDIYKRLIFNSKEDLNQAPHILQLAPDLADRVIITNSVSKSCSMTGWRVGWAIGPAKLITYVGDFFSQSTSNVCSIAQKAAIAGLNSAAVHLPNVNSMLKKRMNCFLDELGNQTRFDVNLPDGAFYLWLGVSSFFGKVHKKSQIKINNSKDLAMVILEHHGIAAVPGAEFGDDDYLRLSIAANETVLKKAAQRLKEFNEGVS